MVNYIDTRMKNPKLVISNKKKEKPKENKSLYKNDFFLYIYFPTKKVKIIK
jgi:hypothetical protein